MQINKNKKKALFVWGRLWKKKNKESFQYLFFTYKSILSDGRQSIFYSVASPSSDTLPVLGDLQNCVWGWITNT
jgi:hypothetical protein